MERLATLLGGLVAWFLPYITSARGVPAAPGPGGRAAGAPATPESVHPLYLRRPAISAPPWPLLAAATF